MIQKKPRYLFSLQNNTSKTKTKERRVSALFLFIFVKNYLTLLNWLYCPTNWKNILNLHKHFHRIQTMFLDWFISVLSLCVQKGQPLKNSQYFRTHRIQKCWFSCLNLGSWCRNRKNLTKFWICEFKCAEIGIIS